MSRSRRQGGFTLVELLVVMVLIAIVSDVGYRFFSTTLNQYLALQQNSTVSGELALNSQRIGNVLRGSTGIVSAAANDLTVYAYFSPNDTYVSQIRYYLNNNSTQLMADITPMTANPPIGTPITAQKKTYTIIQDYFKSSSLNLFAYLDSSANALSLPIVDLNTIKSIQINLFVPINKPTPGGNQQVSLQVSLRNRKTNL